MKSSGSAVTPALLVDSIRLSRRGIHLERQRAHVERHRQRGGYRTRRIAPARGGLRDDMPAPAANPNSASEMPVNQSRHGCVTRGARIGYQFLVGQVKRPVNGVIEGVDH